MFESIFTNLFHFYNFFVRYKDFMLSFFKWGNGYVFNRNFQTISTIFASFFEFINNNDLSSMKIIVIMIIEIIYVFNEID